MKGLQSRTDQSGIFGHSSTLVAATVSANLLSVAGYVLLVQVYSMQLVGEYFSIIAAANIIAVFVHFGLLQAIPLMDERELKLGATLLSAVSMATAGVGILLSFIFSSVAFVLMTAGVLSVIALVETVLIRAGHISTIAVLRISVPLFSFSGALAFGLLDNSDSISLISGYLTGLALVGGAYFIVFVFPLLERMNLGGARDVVQRYRNFPTFIGPGLLCHTAAYSLPSIVGLHFFGGVAVAAYNIAYKFVLAPMTIVGKAIGQAYVSKLSAAYRNRRTIESSLRLDAALAAMAVVAVAGIYFVFPIIAALFFSEAHEDIRRYAFALIPITFSMLTVSPLSSILQFTNNQQKIFVMHLVSFIFSVVSLALAVYVESLLVGITVFSMLIFLRYGWLYAEILKVRAAL